MDDKLAVILPAKNEEFGLAAVIDEIHKLKIKPDIIVAEHGSTDNTVAVAQAKGARVISCPFPGKGIGVRHVFSKIVGDERYTYIIMLDADYTYPAAYIPEILRRLKAGADVVCGVRTDFEPGSMSRLHRFANKVICLWASILYKRKASDLLTGMWGFRVNIIPDLQLYSTGFTLEADIWTGAVKARLSIVNVPIGYRKRLGSTKIRWKDGLKIVAYVALRKIA